MLVVDKGFKNLIFVFGTNQMNYDGVAAPPFGLSEFGQSFGDSGTGAGTSEWDTRTPESQVRDSCPPTAFAVFWYTSTEANPPRPYIFTLPDVSFGDRLIDDPLIDTQ